ncbi:glutamyl-tRNA reductase hemA [Candidatus Kinetoplastibacterium blastocrithidii TCC012E]|uniref:Glutamyl-tRNA reductase n=2 Tax=Candidatus Kinetoplastidibacterium blastocrithidiae TaxID=233181 RepID=M1MCJ5_9PROT|nr:glutamyl-tRNA reductase [Candidatus Kinetoplastibacterium blastocrithidii]AEM25283.1 glutamyl-tRNA reductase [Candidatus Kinetoplastibacterium blastocrithidii]AFZ83424.1 glutamyl-tRNA reductase [Candidatus Kinetoplastibacterium blastocrithidii (ex Strigomonas culicis)]AGF49520.1 glutamyl-tRNA reductase hemA [Candidatus Kinetoplastibacterium blastocrithidii TCC012E]
MSYVISVIGLNHTSAPLMIRERMSMPNDTVGFLLSSILSEFRNIVSEAVILSTCNRTELYCYCDEKYVQELVIWFSGYGKVDPSYFYNYVNDIAVKHIFSVSCGLDSIIIGEPQILSQMKKSVFLANEARSLGTYLYKLFQCSFSASKEVRTHTDLCRNHISISSASIDLVKTVFQELEDLSVLFIGAGEIIELSIKSFVKHKHNKIVVTNRTSERSDNLSKKFSIESIPFNSLKDRLYDFDVIVSCTSSDNQIIQSSDVANSFNGKKIKPMVMIDLAVPRDIDIEVSSFKNITLYSIDDLQKVIKKGFASRSATIPYANEIIEKKTKNFMRWIKSRDNIPSILELINKANNISSNEVELAKRALMVGGSPDIVIERMARRITKKFLHGPISFINSNVDLNQDILSCILDIFSKCNINK